MEEWLGEIDKHIPFISPLPENYYPRETYQNHWKCCSTTAKERLRKLVESGNLEVRMASIVTPTGKKVIPHYGPPAT